MRIFLIRRAFVGGLPQTAEEYVRIAFAHITHLIVIQNVEGGREGAGPALFGQPESERIIVNYMLQPGTAGIDIVAAITEAVQLRGDLELERIEAPLPVVEIPAIRPAAQPAAVAGGVAVYDIHFLYAQYLAREAAQRAALLEGNPNILDVTLEFERVDAQHLRYTGRIATRTHGVLDAAAQLVNPYRRLAQILHQDPALRARVLADDFRGLTMEIRPNGQVSLSVSSAANPAMVARP